MTELTTEKSKHDYCVEALKVKKGIEFGFIELGEMLYRIKGEKLFEAGWSSWEEYQMELRLPQSTISKLFRIYEVFVLHFKFSNKALTDAGGWATLAELLPVISPETTPRERVKELLGIASEQTRDDLRKTVKVEKRGAECRHTETHFLKLEVCDGCGERWKV